MPSASAGNALVISLANMTTRDYKMFITKSLHLITIQCPNSVWKGHVRKSQTFKLDLSDTEVTWTIPEKMLKALSPFSYFSLKIRPCLTKLE